MFPQRNHANAKFDIPELLKEHHNWLVWRLTQKPGQAKPSKVPYYANGKMRSGEQGSPEDRAALVSFDEAVGAAEVGGFSGVGMALLPGLELVALDFDYCVDESGKVTVPFISDIAMVTYTEYSPSGKGIRAFMRGNLPSKKDTQPKGGGFAVEVFGDSGFVTVTGHVLDDCLMFGNETVVADVTEDVLALYKSRWGDVASRSVAVIGSNGVEDDNDAWLMSLKNTQGWTLEQAREYLFDCDAGCDRQHWVNAGMALHFEFDGSDEARDLYNEWSAKGESYNGVNDVIGRWRSFGKRGGGGQITGLWLMKWRGDFLKRKAYAAVENWKTEIKSARDEYSLREGVVPKIKLDPLLGRVERESLAQALLDAFKSMGTKLPIGECRKMLAPQRVVTDAGMPDYFAGIVYVTDVDRFYCRKTNEVLTVQGFNSKFNRLMPRDEHGNIEVAANVMALDQCQVPVVMRSMYVPYMGEFFKDPGNYGDDAATFVNSFRPESVPSAASSELGGDVGAVGTVGAGARAVEIVTRHIEQVLCGGRADVAEQLLSFLAFNVQNPGRKVRWMPLIKGIEGDGKSLLFGLMAAVMGFANVKSVSPTVLTTDFTGWGEGSCFTVFEELRLVGHNRHDVHNRIKPFITNDVVNIHKKGRDAYDGLNVTNYLAVTNSKTALPLNDSDRRCMVIFTKYETRSELDSLLDIYGGAAAYFVELHSAIAERGSDLRRWLLDYKLASSFNPNGTAPLTSEKQRMIATNISEDSQLIQEIIDAGGVGISKNAFVSTAVRDQFLLTEEGLTMTKNQYNIELQKLGWEKYPKRIKFNGATEILWVRGGVTWDDATRKILQETEKVENLFECQ